ncbi:MULTISPECIES: hypothetical protein [Caldilinea]|jgi:hypothetical protein|uniref:hypothetical protein n=1 Tax=Caldilinea TaxID=233191 RepID=UPI0005C70933|nr:MULTISPECIES: hypothetical protein [Caldilinea]GIV75602.1 MAG: hypothetical protein KatS3mg049_4158 [Caldilinea sp.]
MEIYLLLRSGFFLFLGGTVLLIVGVRFRKFRHFAQAMIVAWSAYWSIQFGRGFGAEDKSFLIIMGLAGSILGMQAAWLIHYYGNTRPSS